MSSTSHFVVFCTPLFGHVRPTFTFCMNLLNQHPNLHITYISTGTTSPSFSLPFEREMKLYNLQPEPRSRLNLKLLGEGAVGSMMDQMVSLFTSLPTYLAPLLGNPTAKEATAIARIVCLPLLWVVSNKVIAYWAKTIEFVALNLNLIYRIIRFWYLIKQNKWENAR